MRLFLSASLEDFVSKCCNLGLRNGCKKNKVICLTVSQYGISTVFLYFSFFPSESSDGTERMYTKIFSFDSILSESHCALFFEICLN